MAEQIGGYIWLLCYHSGTLLAVVNVNLNLICGDEKVASFFVSDSTIIQELYLIPEFRFLKKVEKLKRILREKNAKGRKEPKKEW